MRAFLRISALAVLAAGFSACGDDVVNVGTVSPTATVGGVVLNPTDYSPIAGASVVLVAGGETSAAVTTDATGGYSFDDVKPGTFAVNVTAPAGFWNASMSYSFVPTVGDYAMGNLVVSMPAIGLVPAGSSRSIRILGHNGQPISGYSFTGTVAFAFFVLDDLDPNAYGSRTFSATTDADGIATFANLPNYSAMPFAYDQFMLRLPAYDLDSDGINEFSGANRYLYLANTTDPTNDIILEPNTDSSLYVVASTIGQLEGGGASYPLPAVVGPTDPIYVKFNVPIDATAAVTVSDETGAAIAQSVSTDVLGDLLTITFGAPLGPGFEYNMRIHAVAHNGDRIFEGDFFTPFFTISAAPITAAISLHPTNPGYLRVTFTEPVGIYPGSAYSLSWGNCVAWFNADLNASTTTGDYPSEYGYDAACDGNWGLSPAEPDPWGVGTISGYTKYWDLVRPPSVGTGVGIQLRFSRVTDWFYTLERANGDIVPDQLTGLFVP